MYNEWQIGIITIMYIAYIVGINWMYIREYTQSKGNVIRREWEN